MRIGCEDDPLTQAVVRHSEAEVRKHLDHSEKVCSNASYELDSSLFHATQWPTGLRMLLDHGLKTARRDVMGYSLLD